MNYLNFSTKAASRQERSAQWQMITRAPSAELGDDREASIRGCDLGELRLASVAMGEHRLENDRAVLADPENGLVKFLFLRMKTMLHKSIFTWSSTLFILHSIPL